MRLQYVAPIILLLAGCGSQASKEAKTDPATLVAEGGTAAPVAGEFKDLKVIDTKEGTGKGAEEGDTIWVTYTGKFKNGKVFDSSDNQGGVPFSVIIGSRQVIEGWEKGLIGLKAGGERTMEIPWRMAYGERGNETIPAKSDLIFDVKALALVKKGEEGVIDVTEISKGTGAEVKEGSLITVKYSGKLMNDEEFDSNNGKPLTFRVGNGEVVDGFDAGVVGMKKGGKRVIVIPPRLGFPFGGDGIPPNSVVKFEVEIVDVN